ncbi:MAG: L-lactate dehydrogenase (quinone) large subunit LdhH [Bacillota bacterium]
MKDKFREHIRQALSDRVLQDALGRFADAYPQSRAAAYQSIDTDALRESIANIKDQAVQNLEELANTFETEARQRGASVYRAKNDIDATSYIADLANSHQIKKVIKSKSMVSEEIHLNRHLEEQAIEVVESDLGEWIIQLAGQKPSHMVMPAIHLNRRQVAEIFSKHLGRSVPDDIDELAKIARIELRKHFLTAGMGITGANLAIASTGTLMVVSNEGNARLTSTLPPVHVALIGYEKLVPSMQDAAVILQALPRSATGQKITSYVSFISGPVPVWGSGGVQAKELHIVIVDNGRLEMAKDPVFREVYRCIRCASCLNVCPVYQLVGGHVFGHIYTGGIGTILTAFLHSWQEADPLQDLCIGCRRCAEFCPGKINIPDLILEMRQRLITRRKLPWLQKAAMEKFLAKPSRMRSALRVASKLQLPAIKEGQEMFRSLPMGLSRHTAFRSLPALAAVPFHRRAKELLKEVSKPWLKAAFYGGCLVDYSYPRIGEAVFKVLQRMGVQVVYPDGQCCCGAPAAYQGDVRSASQLAMLNIEALEQSGADVIITACPTCSEAIKHRFGQWLAGNQNWEKRAQEAALKTIDFSSFVWAHYQRLELNGLEQKKAKPIRLTYHDSCHLKRSLGVFREPRELLSSLPGISLVEMEGADQCCGFGGSFSLKFPEISAGILEKKLCRIAGVDPDLVAVDCPGCLLQLAGGLDRKQNHPTVKHTAEILATHLRLEDRG